MIKVIVFMRCGAKTEKNQLTAEAYISTMWRRG